MTTKRLISWNVNGLRAAHKKGLLSWIADDNPDILCIQETKANEDQLPDEVREIPGYKAYFASAERKGYSGVAIYSKTEPLSVSKGFGINEFDSEGRTLIADFGEFLLFCVYFPNGKRSPERLDYKMRFYDSFLGVIDQAVDAGRNVIICGDVNTAHKEIDLARPKENEKISGFLPMEREWQDKLLSHGHRDTLRMFNQDPGQYSYWDTFTRARDRNVGWRIDYFYVNEAFSEKVKNAYILADVMGSDHCPIGIDLELTQ